MNKLEIELLETYKNILKEEEIPDWSYECVPAIPFVGNNFDRCKKRVLVYGSAENLRYLNDHKSREKICNNYLRNRENYDDKGFFTKIHIQPINDGSLLTASRYILSKLGYDNDYSDNPKEYLEEISSSNFSKFSINNPKRNMDPVKKKYLKDSLLYIIADIKVLKPDIIILPHTIYKFQFIKKVLEEYVSNVKIIKIYQTNIQVINLLKIQNNYKNYKFTKEWLNPKNSIKGMDKYCSWLEKKIKEH